MPYLGEKSNENSEIWKKKNINLFPTLDYGILTLDYVIWTKEYGLWTTVYGIWISDFGLRTLDFGLWTMDWALGVGMMPNECPNW